MNLDLGLGIIFLAGGFLAGGLIGFMVGVGTKVTKLTDGDVEELRKKGLL